ncbi:hypothetical protein [Desulfonatronospira sp.]|uniref:hypothetical protein n=1 Tax=Desulfonatronospira sp. TaxID=1962951 RepID=UPI0025C60959|nr:hypothetical protein [Desulfonatronospira sp.]
MQGSDQLRDKKAGDVLIDLYHQSGTEQSFPDFVLGMEDSALSWKARHEPARHEPLRGSADPVEWQRPVADFDTQDSVLHYDTPTPLVPFTAEAPPLPKQRRGWTHEEQVAPEIQFIDGQAEDEAAKGFFGELRRNSPHHFSGMDDQEIYQYLFDLFARDHPGDGRLEFEALMQERIINTAQKLNYLERARREATGEQKI